MDSLTLFAGVGLIAFSVAALVYVLLGSRFSPEAAADRRMKRFVSGVAERKAAATIAATRKKSVQDVLKDIELKQKSAAKRATSPPLSLALEQAGLTFGMRGFWMMSAGFAVGGILLVLILGGELWQGALAGGVFAFVMPRGVVGFLRRRRQTKFVDNLPDALEVLIRSLKAGLSFNDGLRIVATESQEPVRTEFRRVMDELPAGVPLETAIQRMANRMPVAEANYLAIVISIQSKAGGNLAEALGNLAKVLRERKKIKAKIKALSAEAKASAYIIGALPFIVVGLIRMSAPDYINRLFFTEIGHIALIVSGIWMIIGIAVMSWMIRIDV